MQYDFLSLTCSAAASSRPCPTGWESAGTPRMDVACSHSRPGTNFGNPWASALARAAPRPIFSVAQLSHTPRLLRGPSREAHSPMFYHLVCFLLPSSAGPLPPACTAQAFFPCTPLPPVTTQ